MSFPSLDIPVCGMDEGMSADLFSSVALRIHEHIERGDNDTIKTAGDRIVKAKPCSK